MYAVGYPLTPARALAITVTESAAARAYKRLMAALRWERDMLSWRSE